MGEKNKIEKFEDLIVWKEAVDLYVSIDLLFKSSTLKINNTFVYQLTKAALSISNNIAEGYERNGNKEFVQFLFIAKGSCGEVRSMLNVLQKINSESNFETEIKKCQTISVKIYNLISYLKNSELKGIKYKDSFNEPIVAYGLNHIEQSLNHFEQN